MRRHIGTFLIAAGLLFMAWPVVTWGYGLYWQERLKQDWQARAPAAASAVQGDQPAAAAAAEPPSFARLWVERIGLDAMVVEGIDAIALRRGPGHLPQTARPGESGNCVIAAHRDGWFRRLEEVQPGDVIGLETPDCGYEYVVDEKKVVDPDRGDLLATSDYPTVTLITCTGPGYPHSAYRLLVFCRLQAVHPS
jgi:LPXTG-site transpeptidase (sortase) family protein